MATVLATKVFFPLSRLHFRCLAACQRNCSNANGSSSPLSGKTVRIGCASGFWGDTATAAPQLIHQGNIEFLVFDYLAEITMSLLAAAKQKDQNFGYAPDFVRTAIGPFIKDIKKKGIRVVSNAGGVNPQACAVALQEVAKKSGVDLKIATIFGDDLMPQLAGVAASGVKDLDSGDHLPKTIHSMNAYLGARPISRALDHGADVVITGRCVDSAVVLGPLLHTFGWKTTDYDLLAAGSLAGHIVECGAQGTGGIFTDWHTIPDWDKMGFPIVEVASDGQFIVSKPPGTGGLVSVPTVSEQIVYEIGDPRAYLLPDVSCNFADVTLKEIDGHDGGAVFVTGAKGKPPSKQVKVSATYFDGYRALAVCAVGGPRSVDKARRTAESILKRVRRIYKQLGMEDFKKVQIQVIGAEETYGPHANPTLAKAQREVALWFGVQHNDRRALQLFAGEIAPAGTGMAPGLTGIVGGRPRVSPVLKLFSFLYNKENLKINIHVDGQEVETMVDDHGVEVQQQEPLPAGETEAVESGSCTYRLEDLAYTRSGDKGNSCNIGVVARCSSYLPYLRAALTPEAVEQYFQHLLEPANDAAPQVIRYDVPGLHALNFVLKNSLGGGGVASLRSDPQGKAYGQMLLDFKITNVPKLVQ
ncbi:PREDICTED: uncharacterized protein LOC109467868 [Branchiostoma belcheri]|uniref:Uncharacterized protein LOC109467868 n=1 Tax=Branchiostoma belcheri TaxID=7741 RepID=A0A6P4YAP0_BRABE|nr:PREDICTED: uncharacterized protein LOC109467868 [Branchiostoma belcheri]